MTTFGFWRSTIESRSSFDFCDHQTEQVEDDPKGKYEDHDISPVVDESQPETNFLLSLVLELVLNSKYLDEFLKQSGNDDIEIESLKGS